MADLSSVRQKDGEKWEEKKRRKEEVTEGVKAREESRENADR
jgi:hypothetical protein